MGGDEREVDRHAMALGRCPLHRLGGGLAGILVMIAAACASPFVNGRGDEGCYRGSHCGCGATSCAMPCSTCCVGAVASGCPEQTPSARSGR